MKIENIKCPECGGKMIPRNGKYGKFWGCNNYPDCKGTRDSLGRSKEDRESEKEDDNEDEPKWHRRYD
jgi:ssDNA-binding Zn-finger/Zn-ribbon topoisomerase 1